VAGERREKSTIATSGKNLPTPGNARGQRGFLTGPRADVKTKKEKKGEKHNLPWRRIAPQRRDVLVCIFVKKQGTRKKHIEKTRGGMQVRCKEIAFNKDFTRKKVPTTFANLVTRRIPWRYKKIIVP